MRLGQSERLQRRQVDIHEVHCASLSTGTTKSRYTVLGPHVEVSWITLIPRGPVEIRVLLQICRTFSKCDE